jgi:pimeloyl-ACP methyl ester carboxylesterase
VSSPQSVKHGPFHWEYLVFGNGPELLLAFHGFDNNADDFRLFEPLLGQQYTIVAVNLFYHGRSYAEGAPDQLQFRREDLQALITQLLERFPHARFSLLGFSLGGRICLELVSLFAGRVDRLILLAPDGLVISPWYVFVTRTIAGRWLFRRVLRRPQRFLRLGGWLRTLGLVGEKQYKFALSYFGSGPQRELVFKVWMIFRYLLPRKAALSAALKQHPVRTDLFFGRRDSIIRPSFGIIYQKKVDAQANIHILETGHNLLKSDVAERVLAVISRQ